MCLSSLLGLRLTCCVSQRCESLSWHNTFVFVFLNSHSFLEQGDDCMLLQHYKWKVKCLKATKRKILVCKHNAKSALPGVSLCVPLTLLRCDLTRRHGAWLWPDSWASAGASQGGKHWGLHPDSGPAILRKAPEALLCSVKVSSSWSPRKLCSSASPPGLFCVYWLILISWCLGGSTKGLIQDMLHSQELVYNIFKTTR